MFMCKISITTDCKTPQRDADHVGCIDSCKSTSGGIQFLGDKLDSWMSKKQNCTAMSSAEAEYVALSASCAQVMWMRTQLQYYGFNYNKISLYCGDKLVSWSSKKQDCTSMSFAEAEYVSLSASIAISCNLVQHSRTKHIIVRYHFIKEKVEKGIVELFFVGTEYQLADLFTKALPVERFQYLVRRLGMRCLTPAELEALENESAWFVQLLIDHQLGDMSHHKDIYDNPSFTKKVFANMKRVGIGFSGVVTLLFDNMLVLAAKEVGLTQDDVQSISIFTEPSTSKPHKKHKPKKQQTQAPNVPFLEPSPKHRLPSPSNDPLPGERIENLKGRVNKLEEEIRVLKELYSVHSKVDTAAPVVEKEKSFKRWRIITDINEDVEINMEEA
nr:hypothetical protein [Tanacetum cinerariifolium]